LITRIIFGEQYKVLQYVVFDTPLLIHPS
jgi:hypothetical protein